MACCKIQDLSFAIKCYNLCEKFGFDALSCAHVIAFAIDLYQKGILTKEDTEGLHLEYGNAELALEMIKKIALREGIGDILGNGLYDAARRIGRGAEEYAYHVKKLEIPIYPLHHPYLGFVQSIDDRADMLKAISAIPQHYYAKTEQEKSEYINSEFWPYPPDYKDLIWDDFDPEGADYERITKMVSFDLDSNAMADLTGICIFWTGFFPFNPYLFEDQMKLVSYATGNEIDQSEGIRIARRVGTLVRSYNVRLGISRKDDQPPERFFQEPSKPPLFKPKDRGLFDKALDSYYELRGYNKEGIPTRRSLEELNLRDVYDELVKGGILTDEEN